MYVIVSKVITCMYVIVSIKRLRIAGVLVVVCTDFWDKEPYRKVGVGSMVTSGTLCGVMVSTLAQNAKDVGLIPALGTIFLIFICTFVVSPLC